MNQLTLSNKELSSALVHYVARITICLLLAFGYSIVQLFRHGVSTWEYLLVALVSAASILITIGFAAEIKLQSQRPRQSLLGIWTFLPYLIGLYLCLYKGLWSLTHLFSGFSFWILAEAIVWTVIGFHLLGRYRYLSELAARMNKDVVIEQQQ